MSVAYTITSTPVTADSGELWIQQDIGYIDDDGNYIYTADGNFDGGGIPLKLEITPTNTATHTVSAVNFNIAGQNPTDVLESEPLNGWRWLSTAVPAGTLPNAIEDTSSV